MAYRKVGMPAWQKIVLTLVIIIVLAGVAIVLAGLICASINGTGFAEEITSWFVKTVEEAEEAEEIVEATVTSLLSFVG